jgi:alkylation response protein AidB-like acyl-CoA dehydrogenase
MTDTELLEPFERMLIDVASVSRLREILKGGPVDGVWEPLQESGYLDALLDPAHGGAGLSFAQLGALLQAAGRHLLPVPFGETVIARALLAQAGIPPPRGPMVLITPAAGSGNDRYQQAVPLARVAQYALVEVNGRISLRMLSQAAVRHTDVHGSLAADVDWRCAPEMVAGGRSVQSGMLRAIAAVIRAAEIAGAADQLLRMTVAYAGDRAQFGKPIAKLQAVQQQLAVMAEQVVMARMAAQLGCSSGFPPSLSAVAVAKHICGAAVPRITSIAHAIHGAIGISEEHDLQLYVRTLYECRIAAGSEIYWATVLGADYLKGSCDSTVDFVRGMRQMHLNG